MSTSGVNQCTARIVAVYLNHFKQRDIDADMAVQVYHEILDDVNDDLLMAATKQWLSTAHPHPPSPGELRDLALRLVTRDELSADEAWAEVVRVRNRIGSYGVPEWSNARIAITLESFGRWKEFCMIEDDQMSFVRAQFMKIYETRRAREHDDRLMLPETRQKVDALIGQATKRLDNPKGA